MHISSSYIGTWKLLESRGLEILGSFDAALGLHVVSRGVGP